MTQMTPEEHSDLIGGSTAARRINCPGSYLREQKAPKSRGSSYAREGTAYHNLLAVILDKGQEPSELLPFTHKQPPKGVEPAWEHTITADDWDDLGRPALDAFDEFVDALEAETGGDFNYMVEERGEFPGVPGAFGTSDVPFRCGWSAGIIDWKMGRNGVDPEENAQLMFYFAAMFRKYPAFFDGIEEVRLVIIQPRAGGLKEWRTDLERIEDFVETIRVTVAVLENPDAPIEQGAWCQYADCKAVCELHRGAAVKLGERIAELEARKDAGVHHEKDFVGDSFDMSSFLSEAMELAEMAEAWAKQIAVVTQDRLKEGLTVPGWKLVDKKSSGRVWTVDEATVINRLRSRGLKADDYWNKKVITPPQAEKALQKLGKTLPEDIVETKASSGVTLTRDGDPRPRKGSAGEKAAALGSALAKRLGEQ